MPLPKIALPEHDLEIPITGKKLTYRPFLVKEEKLLYLAMESKDEKEMVKAVKTIIKNCTSLLDKQVEKLATFEIEYVFLKIRSKAVGEVSEFKVTMPDDGETQVDVSVPLNEVELQVPDGHDPKIMFTDDVGVIMKYPSLDIFVQQNMTEGEQTIDDVFQLAASCIGQAFDGDEVYDSFTKKEAIDFLESLNSDQFAKIQEFFETIPKLSYTMSVRNPKTKKDNDITFEGLAAFFA